MKTAFLLLLFCLAEADDIRWEFDRFKSHMERQHADMASRLTAKMEELVEELQKHKAANNNLTLEMTQLRSEVKKLKCKTADQCPTGWTKFGDSCYYISTVQKTWQQSREYCQNQGADLVVINSGEEQDFVVRVELTLGGRDKLVWIGLTDREKEGVWKWVDGTPLTTPTYWYPGEPNDVGEGEDCAVFGYGQWHDNLCGRTRYWLCEIVF